MPVLYVAIGGAFGAVARYASVLAIERLTGRPIPWGTLAVNVVGSFVLGCLLIAIERGELSDDARLFAVTGVLGAFTTFSALSWEIVWYLRDEEWLSAGAYAVGSVVLGVAALLAGSALAAALAPGANG